MATTTVEPSTNEAYCAERVESLRFNTTWFYPDRRPNTWRLELVTYIICMIVLFGSMAHRFYAHRFAKNDWLRVRSLPMMVLCHMGALLMFHTGGLSKILASQTQCWFQIVGSLMVVPLLVVPVFLKLVWFKARAIYVEAAKKGAKRVVGDDPEPTPEQPSTPVNRSAFFPNILVARTSLMFASTMSQNEETTRAKRMLVRDLKRWKYLSSTQGMFWISLAVFTPFLVLTLITFGLTDPVFSSTCKGCTIQLVHVIFLAAFAAVSIFAMLGFLYSIRKSPDPFGIIAEIKLALWLGGVPALIAFILNFAARAESWGDGWSWNILVEVSLLVFSFVQGSLQVFVSRKHHSSGDRPKSLIQPDRVRQKSLYDVSTTLGVLFESIQAKKDLHDAFEQYLCGEFAVESLAFVDAVQDYKNGYFDRGMIGSTAYARRIIRSFVTPDATFSINVSADQRARLLAEMERRSPTDPPRMEIFDECADEVKKMLELGPLVRFAQTSEFVELVESGAFKGTPASAGFASKSDLGRAAAGAEAILQTPAVQKKTTKGSEQSASAASE